MRGNTYIFNLVSLFLSFPAVGGGGIKRCRDQSVRLSVPPGPARRAAPRPGHRAVRTADPSAHGRRSAAIGGGISSRRATTCFLCIFIMFTTCQVVLLTVHTDRRDCARTELSMLCGMLVTAAGS